MKKNNMNDTVSYSEILISEQEAIDILREVIAEARTKGETSIAARLKPVYQLLKDPTRPMVVRQ